MKEPEKEMNRMDYTSRMMQSPSDFSYRWYFDVKRGQDTSMLKITAAICGILTLIMFLLVLLAPAGNISPWEAGGFTLGVTAFIVPFCWGSNALIYKMRGEKTRICYTLNCFELSSMTDIHVTKDLKILSNVVTSAGILAESVDSILAGTGMSCFSQKNIFSLEKATRIVLKPGKDMIGLWCGLRCCRIYVSPEDFESLKMFLLLNTPRSVKLAER